ncbi:hypothetical protein EMPS_11282 [Entomortierella parvispora]|uniref:Protein JTB n=1 Tax=Entomortierella parvispora TaxID=205924 RepID=A0A9P3M234_9FUNG|nr:hypothetical protein EMPS_11282 [Entomortierella parvispora]
MSPSIPQSKVRAARALLMITLGLACLTTVFASLTSAQSTSAHSFQSLAKRQQPPQTQPPFACVVIGECVPCNHLQQETEDTCKETHNRQKIECKYDDPINNENEELKVLLPTYRSCLHVKAVEARRFAHFLSTNIFLALFSGILMIWRKRKLAAAQYRRMARRIGIA